MLIPRTYPRILSYILKFQINVHHSFESSGKTWHSCSNEEEDKVPRASASAVAFGMGLFNERGKLGPGRHRAFAVTSENRASDIVLRFHDCCQSYKAFRKSQEPNVNKLKEPVLNEITRELVRKYGLNFTKQDVSSLWFLCKQEASLLNITNQACSLFSPSEVSLLEWADDLELFILKGYGDSLNYRMGVPLLVHVVQSMEQAIKAYGCLILPFFLLTRSQRKR